MIGPLHFLSESPTSERSGGFEWRSSWAHSLHICGLLYLGLEMEVTEWAPDLYWKDTSSWNLDRCYEARKHSRGQTVDLVAPFYIANKWTKKEHFNACIDLFYDVAIITTQMIYLERKKTWRIITLACQLSRLKVKVTLPNSTMRKWNASEMIF